MREGYAQELKDAGLNTVYLKFDGVTEEPYLIARSKNLLDVKLEAIEKCRQLLLKKLLRIGLKGKLMCLIGQCSLQLKMTITYTI